VNKVLRILLVDDSNQFVEVAARFLADQAGLSIVGTAVSGEDAIRQVERLDPDVVLMDVSMPGMGGLEATRRLKARPAPPRVVVVSMHDSRELRRMAEAAGADGYVAKWAFATSVVEAVLGATLSEAGRPDPRASRLRALVDLASRISSTHNVDDALGLIANAVGQMTSARFVSLWLADEAAGTLTLRAWSDPAGGAPYPRRSVSYGQIVVGWVATHRQALHVPDVGTDPWVLDREWFRSRGFTSVMALPLMDGDDLLGVLALAGPTPFMLAADEHDLLKGFVAQAAAAIRSARLREELRATRDLFHSVAETSVDGIVATDLDGRVTYVSGRVEELFGCHAGRLIGRSVQELQACWHDGPQAFSRLAGRIAEGQTVKGYETRISTPDGRLVEASAAVAPLRDSSGKVRGGVAMIRDLTEQTRVQRTLEQAERLALLGGVAHELSNPLAVVVAQAELLGAAAENRGDAALSTMARRILDSATDCVRIVKAFHSLARQGVAEPRPVALNEVVSRVLDSLAPSFGNEGLEIIRALAPVLPTVSGDPDQLHQMVTNLVRNASQATWDGPPPRWMRIATRFDDADGWVVLEVGDSGPGVPEEVRGRIFEPLFTTRPPGEGTGIGLALCQAIVSAHGGTIRVGAAPGGGALFTVELPVGASPVLEDRSEQPPGPTPPESLSGPRPAS
jgi:two-component system NtrC family sensor kinase